MADSNFVDYVKICCRSGKGGGGSIHLHRDRNTAKGGPDGGDGGRGGHIILRGSSNVWTLIHLKYRKHVIAEPGGKGSSALKHGKDGDDIILEVPLGTVARDAETGEVHFEITEEGEDCKRAGEKIESRDTNVDCKEVETLKKENGRDSH